MTILISTIPGDLHARAVVWGLEQLGVNSFLWIPSDLPDKAQAMLYIDSHDHLSLHCGDKDISSSEISVFWNRRRGLPIVPEAADVADHSAIALQSRELAENVQFMLAELVPAINPPTNQHSADNKAIQLRAAKSAGFAIPRTSISNDAGKVRNFVKSNHNSIAKPFKPCAWEIGENLYFAYASSINQLDDVADESIEWCPYIYQNKIDISFEVRLIYFGGQFHGMKQSWDIDAGPDSRHNLRMGVSRVEKIDIQLEIKEKVVKYMEIMGLAFGAFDFGVDKEGNWVFYECNESGQFLYLEAYVPEIKILDAFCRWLASYEDNAEYSVQPEISFSRFMDIKDQEYDFLDPKLHKDFAGSLIPVVE